MIIYKILYSVMIGAKEMHQQMDGIQMEEVYQPICLFMEPVI